MCCRRADQPVRYRPEYIQFLLLVAYRDHYRQRPAYYFWPEHAACRRPMPTTVFSLARLSLMPPKSMRLLAAVAVAAALFVFFRCTRLGTSICACADNYTGALVVGLDVQAALRADVRSRGRLRRRCWMLCLLLIFDVTPTAGPAYTLLAFVIVITGGLGSMPGALLGGVLIGFTEAMAGLLFTPSAKSMFAFAILVLVLLFRPAGHHGARGPHDRASDVGGAPRRVFPWLLLGDLAGSPDFCAVCLRATTCSPWLILILYFAYIGQAWNIMMGFAGHDIAWSRAVCRARRLHDGGALRAFRYRLRGSVSSGRYCRSAALMGCHHRIPGVPFSASPAFISRFSPLHLRNSRALVADHLPWTSEVWAGLFLPVAQYTHNDPGRLRGHPVMFYYISGWAATVACS